MTDNRYIYHWGELNNLDWDTFFVGTLKGFSRIYQQTFVETYSAVAPAKL